MPAAIGRTWRHRRAEMGLTSLQAGDLLSITGGALRMIENEQRPASLALAYRAARLFKCSVEELVRDDDEPKPKPEPKVEPKVEPTSPPPRRNGKDNKRGPKRETEMRAAS